NLVQLAKVEVARALLLLQKVGRRNHDSDANNFFIKWNKPREEHGAGTACGAPYYYNVSFHRLTFSFFWFSGFELLAIHYSTRVGIGLEAGSLQAIARAVKRLPKLRSGPARNVVTKLIRTIIVNIAGERMPSSYPILSATSSTSP